MTQELILTVLSEEPDPAERAIFEDFLKTSGAKVRVAAGDKGWAARDSNPARRIKSPVLYLMS